MNRHGSSQEMQRKWPSRRIAKWLYNWRSWIEINAIFGGLNLLATLGNLRIKIEVEGAAPSELLKLLLVFDLAVGLGLVITAFVAFFKLPTKPKETGRIATVLFLIVAGCGFVDVVAGSSWGYLNSYLLGSGLVRIILGLLSAWFAQPLKQDRFEHFGSMIGRLSTQGVPEGLRRSRGDHRSVTTHYRISHSEPKTRIRPVKLCGLVVKGRIALPESLEDGLPDRPTVPDVRQAAIHTSHCQKDEFHEWRSAKVSEAKEEVGQQSGIMTPAEPLPSVSSMHGAQSELDNALPSAHQWDTGSWTTRERGQSQGWSRGFLLTVATVSLVAGVGLYVYLSHSGPWRADAGQPTNSETSPNPAVLQTEPIATSPKTLSRYTIDLLEGKAGIGADGYFDANIYNGSFYVLDSLSVWLTVTDTLTGKERLVSVDCKIAPGGGEGKPLQYTHFRGRAGFTLEPGQEWTWRICTAFGM